MMIAVITAVSTFTGLRIRKRTEQMSQNQKWLKICVMTYSMTDEEALSVPIFGASDMMR